MRNGANLEGYLNGGLVFGRSFASLPARRSRSPARSDNDTLIIDFSGGDPIPAAGIAYDGGGPGDFDTLVLTGGTVGSLVYTATDAHSGTVSVDGKLITYAGLEPITDKLAVADRVFVFGAAAGPDRRWRSARRRTALTSPSSESVDFANPSGSVTIRRGDGDDTHRR